MIQVELWTRSTDNGAHKLEEDHQVCNRERSISFNSFLSPPPQEDKRLERTLVNTQSFLLVF